MKRVSNLVHLFLCVLTCFILFSCASMQDDVYIENFSGSSEISDFEKRFCELDAIYFAGGSTKNEEFVKNAKALISEIELAAKNPSVKKAALARLYAIAGLASVDIGNKGEAKKFYEASAGAFKGDPRTLILAYRLGIEKNLSEKMNSFSDKSLLVLEIALTSFSQQDYSAAVAGYDEAFLSLDGFYRSSYGELRNTSWNLRNLPKDADSRNAVLLAQKSLTVMQMLLLANQNPEMLYNHTVGKKLSDKDLYAKISASGLLNPASKPLDSENSVTINTVVNRLIAARFLWNLYNEKKNTPNLLTKYSKAFEGKKRSPIPDVKLDSPDFDAALGCVENEIMHLEDGIEFAAEKEVSGLEFEESIRKIEK
ncbi:MAG: hypothetical protein II821_01950 [Treponema sp.]|nr:hypothetical protein [Treponema sp.]